MTRARRPLTQARPRPYQSVMARKKRSWPGVTKNRAAMRSAWPYHADPKTGEWVTADDGDWCGGHRVECLRILGVLKDRPDLITGARARCEALRPKLEREDQFRGHRFHYSAARPCDHTGDHTLCTLALAAVDAVSAIEMPVNGAMPIGMQLQVKSTTLASRSIVAVDNVHPNLRQDWWAWYETDDDTFLYGAIVNPDVTLQDFTRPDGSMVTFVEYDPDKGRVLREFTLLGAHDESCWSRRQAWAIAGFPRSWEETGERCYLDAAEKLADYWFERTGPGGVPPWDFDDTSTHAPLDTLAAAIMLEQLARVQAGEVRDKGAAAPFLARLKPMIEGLCAHLTPLAPDDMRPRGMLVDGCFNQPRDLANRSELISGNANLLMALSCLETGRVPA